MNKPGITELEWTERFKAMLPPEWRGLWTIPERPSEWDAVLELPPQGVRMGLVIRRDPRVRDYPFGVTEAAQADIVPVLAAPRVPERLQEVLRSHGWGWLDGAGNGWVSLPGQLLIERSGRTPLSKLRHERSLGSFQALQVIRALLHPDHAGHVWSLRDLQHDCVDWDVEIRRLKEPSLGYLSKLTSDLVAEAYLARDKPRGPVRLLDAQGLLDAASRAYSVDRISCFSLQPRKQLEAGLRQVELSSGGYAAWSAFSAADLLAPAVQESKHWMMVAPRHLSELKDALAAEEVNEGANLMLLVPGDDGPFYLGEGIGDHPRCTNPVQTYWDLKQAGGRGEEAAEAILKRCLLPAWRSGGGAR